MCGEHVVLPPFFWTVSGSSPHVRGALARVGHLRPQPGIIPACAGSTESAANHARSDGIIPACAGSTCARLLLQGLSTGIIPACAGSAQFRGEFVDHLVGIIPACAGSTTGVAASAKVTRDHPHMCGSTAGLRRCLAGYGIIPACAGSTTVGKTKLLFIWDHPRMCGSTSWETLRRSSIRDHPRMCGEHQTDFTCSVRRRGSSPHVRGAPRRSRPARAVVGIIPACAGSTGHSRFRVLLIRDHPRMCGEHRSLTPSLSPARGSPRMCGENWLPHGRA